ncbi:hypothetical protein KUTeg_000748, partial [Tegillarca granosa]
MPVSTTTKASTLRLHKEPALCLVGMAHLHGYSVDSSGVPGKKFSLTLTPPEPQMRIFFFIAENETDKI